MSLVDFFFFQVNTDGNPPYHRFCAVSIFKPDVWVADLSSVVLVHLAVRQNGARQF